MSKGPGGCPCKLTGAQVRELEAVLEAGPAAWGWEDQCWALARIAEVVRRLFGVEYTRPGLDLLLHWIDWSVQVPARQAAERDEAAIATWKEATWPVIKEGGGPGRLAGLRRRIRPGLRPRKGRPWGSARPHPRGEGDWRQQPGACRWPRSSPSSPGTGPG
jgi:winged helix-turn-helix protein